MVEDAILPHAITHMPPDPLNFPWCSSSTRTDDHSTSSVLKKKYVQISANESMAAAGDVYAGGNADSNRRGGKGIAA